MPQDPLILVTPDGTAASAAFHLVGLALMSDRDEINQQRNDAWRASHRAWQEKLVAGLLGDVDRVIELRYLAVPGRSGARIEVALALHVTGRNESETRASCERQTRDIAALLNMNDRTYEFDAVVDEALLRRLLAPFTPVDAAEVRRKIAVLHQRLNRRALGFGQQDQVPRADRLSVPAALGDASSRSSLLAFCHLLSQQQAHTLLCIRLGREASSASAEALRFASAWERSARGDWHLVDGEGRRPISAPEQETIVQRLRELGNRTLHDLRVVVASEQPFSDVLVRMIRSEFFASEMDRHCSVTMADPILVTNLFSIGPLRCPPQREDEALTTALTQPEVERVFTLPLAGQFLPGLPNIRSSHTYLPSGLLQQGRLLGCKATRTGTVSVHAGVGGTAPHYYILGQSGAGKSTLLSSMILSDIRSGEGVGVIDPNGDLIEFLMPRIPDDRLDDVVLIDPADRDFPVGLNLLEFASEDERDFVCSEFMKMVQKLWDPKLQEPMAFGPIYHQAMRAAVMTVTSFAEGGTVVDIPRLFEDRSYLTARLKGITDPSLRKYWETTWDQTDKGELRPYVTAKVDLFRQNRTLRRIVGQRRSTIDVRALMDDGKIVLLNLSTGRLGAHDSSFLGAVLVTRLLVAAMSRASLPAAARRSFTLYIDEFQNFTTDTIGTMVSQARKYGLSLVLAHQNLRQLSDSVREDVLGNVGNIISFRPGPADVETIQRYFDPTFAARDLLSLPNWTATARLIGQSGPLTPFSFQTIIDPEIPDESRVERVREQSRERYSRPRAAVEAELARRLSGDCRGSGVERESLEQGHLMEVGE